MILDSQRQHLKDQFSFLSKEDIDDLMHIGTYKKLKNKEVFIKEGDFTPVIIYILKGAIRGYLIEKNGEEKNMFLKASTTFIAAPDCLFDQKPSKYYFQSVQESSILYFQAKEFDTLVKSNLNISQLYIEGLKETIQTMIFRVEMLAGMSPEERYEALMERNPSIFQIALNKHVANYLGITPNSLSRIIKRKKGGK